MSSALSHPAHAPAIPTLALATVDHARPGEEWTEVPRSWLLERVVPMTPELFRAVAAVVAAGAVPELETLRGVFARVVPTVIGPWYRVVISTRVPVAPGAGESVHLLRRVELPAPSMDDALYLAGRYASEMLPETVHGVHVEIVAVAPPCVERPRPADWRRA